MPSDSKWGFLLLWIAASALGGAGVSLVARAAANATGYAVGDAAGAVAAEAAVGVVALGSFMAAISGAQWLVIARQAPWAGRWPLANAAGGAAAGAVMLSVLAAFTAAGGESFVAAGAIAGVVLGLSTFCGALWLLLSARVSAARWLAIAGAAGLVAAAPGSALLGTVVGVEFAAGAGFGAAYGLVTGATLVKTGELPATS